LIEVFLAPQGLRARKTPRRSCQPGSYGTRPATRNFDQSNLGPIGDLLHGGPQTNRIQPGQQRDRLSPQATVLPSRGASNKLLSQPLRSSLPRSRNQS